MEHLTVKAGFEKAVAACLGHVALCDSLEEALAVHNANGTRQMVVTMDGDVVLPQGIVVGGSQDRLSGILLKKKELKELRSRLEALEQASATEQARQGRLEKESRERESELQQVAVAARQAAQEEIEAEKAVYRIGEDLKNAQRHLDILQLEQEQLMGEEIDMDEEISKYHQALSEIGDEIGDAQEAIRQCGTAIENKSARLEQYDQRLLDLKLQNTGLQAQLENSGNTLRRLREYRADSAERLEQLKIEYQKKKVRRDTTRKTVETQEGELARRYEALQRLEQSLGEKEAAFEAFDGSLRESEGKIGEIRSQQEETGRKIRIVELEQSQHRIKQENIASRLFERYHKPLAGLRQILEEADQKDRQIPVEQLPEEIERYRKRIDRIGDVNLGAIREYEELEKRYAFLVEQRDDLEKAIADLHKVIRKINRISQQRFLETFEAINQQMAQVFPKLFEGGTAVLELTEPDKPLETGVELMIHLPGKKLTRMSLLSGGEKALSAIAFIFSIFMIRPASFCLLDEIDAPLDEANILRFNALLQMIGEKSQIVMITHNKRTMEFADTLFGITMEKKGISKVVSVNLVQ
jgi:chromosome segregation protein